MGGTQNDYTDNISRYFKEIGDCKPLSLKDERDLIAKAKNGDIEARNLLIKSNLKFVVSIAKSYKGMGIPMDELISEGNMGLMKGIDRFDASNDVKLITYAVFWIKESITSSIKRERARVDVTQIDELAAMSRNNDGYVEYNIEDKSSDDDEKEINNIDSIMGMLTEKEKNVIVSVYGLDGKKAMTFQEVGKKMHISSERARQIKIDAIDKVRIAAMLLE